LLADEYDHENWLDAGETDRLDQVLDAILVRSARFCPVLLTWLTSGRKTWRAQGYHRPAFSGRSGSPLA
jgi:hypothetical protein